MTKSTERPLVCNLGAIPEAGRDQHLANSSALFALVQECLEVDGGYAFAFPNQPSMVMQMARFVEYERRCCSWASFSLEVGAEEGPLWLRMSGTAESRGFLKIAFAQSLGIALPTV